MIGEPKPALRIENDIIRPFQRLTVTVCVQGLCRARNKVHPLNTASGIACRLLTRVYRPLRSIHSKPPLLQT